jgi:tetratricopeptide (TPR) repeat protein
MEEISLQVYCGQIESMIDQGRYAEAVAHAKHILQQYPKHVGSYRLLGRAMLEARQSDYAVDMFLRVLSADPEDMLVWVALSEVHNERGELDAAVWYLERAFELAVDNKLVEEELRQLYGRRDGAEPMRVQLTRGALARLYLKGDLLSRAVSELRALQAEHPERVDLEVALAEALWRNEQRLEASEVCQKVLDQLPYCLKANLILGEIWTNSGREEGQTYLRRAEALDPESGMAHELFGDESPLPAQEVRIAPLAYRPPTEEERPAWMVGVEATAAEVAPLSDREATLVDITAALEAQIEIPPWLEEIEVGEEAPAPEVSFGPAEPLEEPSFEKLSPVAAEEVPEWLAGVGEGEEEAGMAEEVPEWLTELGAELPGEEEVPAVPGEGEAPDWLADLGEEAVVGEEVAPAVSAEEQPPDWLAGLREQFAEEGPALEEEPAPVPAEIPDWLQELAPAEGAEPVGIPEVEEPAPVEEALPTWLEGEEMPSGEEALAWLEGLAVGKEEELRAQAEAEAEARMAEIMGRPAPEAPPEEAVGEEVAAPPVEEAFGWTAFEEPEEEALPAWLEGGEMPSGEEALAWLEGLAAGKEEELRAQAEAEAEARMAEIMGRPAPEMPPEEVGLEEAVAPPVEEAFGWTTFGEPEMPPEPVVTEAAPPESFGFTAFGEAEAPPEAAAAMEKAPLEVEEEMPPPEEIPIPEAVLPVEEVVAPQVPPEEEVAPVPAIEEMPMMPEMEVPEPVEGEILPVEAGPPPKVPTVEAAAKPFAAERAYLKEHPRDYEARLALARALWQVGEKEGALEAYSRVIRAGKFLDTVVVELEEYLEQWPDVATQRVLGDAYMKGGRLEEALAIYRQALEAL